MNTKTEKPKYFGPKTDRKNSQNRKTENPNAPVLFILQSSIMSQILEFIYWTVTIFSFHHMTDENWE